MSSISGTSSSPIAAASGTQQNHRAHRRQEFTNALKSLGVDDKKAADIQKQIDDALKSARASGGASSRQAVKSTIDSILQKNGVDPQKLQDAIRAQHQGGGHTNDGDGDDHPTSAATPSASAAAASVDLTA
ncbi:MAG: hypothetical protein GC200_03770 [Tepidisphaera sp.]|nr:hypothetical protein [Tepidisphaera sp.]